MVIEMASVAIVIMAVTRLERNCGAWLEPPLNRNQTELSPRRRSMLSAVTASAQATATIASGSAHRLERTAYQRVRRRGIISCPRRRAAGAPDRNRVP